MCKPKCGMKLKVTQLRQKDKKLKLETQQNIRNFN